MQTQLVRNTDGTWDLLVNGVPRVRQESLAFCENVQATLKHGISAWPTEADEVAEVIRASA